MQLSGWKWLKDDGKPLFKRLWNAAELLAVALIEAGAMPVATGLEAMRRYADLRAQQFMDKASEIYQYSGMEGEIDRWLKAKEYWESKKRRFAWDDRWDYTFNTGPP